LPAEIGVPYPVEIFAVDENGRIDLSYNERVVVSVAADVAIHYYQKLAGYEKKTSSIAFTMQNGRSGVFYLVSPHCGNKILEIISGGRAVCAAVSFSPYRGALSGTLRITEIMFDTEAVVAAGRLWTNLDWIEIRNISPNPITASDVVLEKWGDGEYSHSQTALPSFALPPGGYAVIAENTNDFSCALGAAVGTNVSTLVQANFRGFSLNQRIVLRDTTGVIDAVAYSRDSSLDAVQRLGTSNGIRAPRTDTVFISLERRNGNLPSLHDGNWNNAHYRAANLAFVIRSAGTVVTNDYPMFATPGFAHTASAKTLSVGIARREYLYSPRNGPIEFPVNATLPCRFEAKIFSANGCFAGNILPNARSCINDACVVLFDGTAGGRKLRPGLYFFQVCAVDDATGAAASDKTYFLVRE
jgi:hypothetical protein